MPVFIYCDDCKEKQVQVDAKLCGPKEASEQAPIYCDECEVKNGI